MDKPYLTWLMLLSITNLWIYARVLNLYDKVKHIYFLISVCDSRLDKIEEKEKTNV